MSSGDTRGITVENLSTFYDRLSQVRCLAAVGTMHLDNWCSAEIRGENNIKLPPRPTSGFSSRPLWKRRVVATF